MLAMAAQRAAERELFVVEAALRRVCAESEAAVRDGVLVLLISDRYLVEGKLPIHALLATGAIHNHLVRLGLRCNCNLLIETGTARDPHHFACLIGYGATSDGADMVAPSGEGALRRAFEQLKDKLALEGLFEQARKRALPRLPRRIAA